jgi:oligopeptide transport system substrate-binding protein
MIRCFFAIVMAVLISASCTKSFRMEDGKVLNIVVPSGVKGFDPIYANDRYSGNESGRVYETLLGYHYLKRPFELEPVLAKEMPTVSKDGLTYTFKVRSGVLFHDDKCFPEGKGRELTAHDFAYSIKRLADPKLQGLGWWVIDGKIAGLNQWRLNNKKREKVDYEEAVEGIKVLDKYTIQFKLSKSFPQFLYAMAMGFTAAVPREAVEKYGRSFMNHPIGTGPFRIKDGIYRQTKRIEYYKNPTYWNHTYPCEGAEEFVKQGFLKDCGKQLPLVDKLVVQISEESQPRWLNFERGRFDYIQIPKDNFDSVIPDGKTLSKDMVKRGITLQVVPQIDITYSAFNHDLKLFQNKPLRQAISLAYNINKVNELFFNNTGFVAQSVVPPGLKGYDPNFKNEYRGYGTPENILRAKELLKKAGYPAGKGLPEITYDVSASTVGRQMAEYFKKCMNSIGIKIKVIQSPWPEFQEKITTRRVMMFGMAWGADYPDAENFLQLFYGANRSPGANGSGYTNEKFDRKYLRASTMQDSAERTKLYDELNKFVADEVPVIFGLHRQMFILRNSWLKNYIYTDFERGTAIYFNIDLNEKAEVFKNE